MTWVRVDDRFPHHPKVGSIPPRYRLAAMGLHIEAMCYCSTYLTDGVVPAHVVRSYPRPLVEVLVNAQLWHRAGDGAIQIHDYLDYNPSKEVVQAERQLVTLRKAEAGRMGGIASGIARSTKHRASVLLEANAKQNEAPSRPVPSRPVSADALTAPGLDSDEARLFAQLAQRGAFIRPESGLGRRLVSLIDRRGIEAVMEAAQRLGRSGRLSDRQWVFGLEGALDTIPDAKAADAEEAVRKRSANIDAQMQRRREELSRNTGNVA